jgi:hypothetical protein
MCIALSDGSQWSGLRLLGLTDDILLSSSPSSEYTSKVTGNCNQHSRYLPSRVQDGCGHCARQTVRDHGSLLEVQRDWQRLLQRPHVCGG